MTYRFDSYVLDTDRRTLTYGGEPLALTPKVFLTLTILVEHRDRVMSKDELCQLIWPDQFVEEANLTQNISVLRRLLDEAHTGKKYIATFHGHGYRFLEPVSDGKAVADEPLAAPIKEGESGAVASPEAGHVEPAGKGISTGWIAAALFAGLGLSAAGVVLGLWLHHRNRPEVLELRTIQTLTRIPGAQYQPAWTHDGKAFAFVNTLGDLQRSALYIQEEGELQPRQVTFVDGELSSPTWSPDGKLLAFISFVKDQAKITIYDRQQKTFHDLADLFGHRYGLSYRHMDWSPDGALLVVDDKTADMEPLSLYLVHVNNGQKSRMTYPTMDIIGDVAPRFSPDGQTLAFVRITYQGQNDIETVPVIGGEAAKITRNPTRISDVDWESNRTVIFAAHYDEQFRFWHQDIDNAQHKAELALRMGTDLPIQFSIEPAHRRIAYSAYAPNLNIWSVDTGESHAWKPVITTPGQDIEPAISPDGTKIAFRSDVSGEEQLWVSDVNGDHAHRIDTPGMIPAVHAWDTDSDMVMFDRRNSPGFYEVSTSKGGTPTLITGHRLSHPAPSIDGKSFFVRTGRFLYRLWHIDGHVEKLTDQGGSPVVQSSDGRYIYFSLGRMEGDICRFDLETRQQTLIISSLMPGYQNSWALTKMGIYFMKSDKGRPVIAFHSFTNNAEHTFSVFQGEIAPVGEAGFAVSPNGDQLLVVRAEPIASSVQSIDLGPPAAAN